MAQRAQLFVWDDLPTDQPMARIDRKRIIGSQMMLSHVTLHKGFKVGVHTHENEQFAVLLSGRMVFTLEDGPDGASRTIEMTAGSVLHLPSNVPHGAEAVETSVILDLFSPPSEKTGVDKTPSE
ncbi:MAG: cupin domain-containing protein [Phycisphaeraceae bacterium]|nr:cupin domain-containing protein [Phycisphaerales bacterium]MCB9859299.1 cupin domain-containing protein [Phycisphaeraceae bacterium]